jgi:FMN-dependent NADH-azoreductase
MKKILHIISSPRGNASISIKLGNAIVEKIKSTYPDSLVQENNLVANQFPHLEEAHLTSFFTAPENRSAENQLAIKPSESAIQELMDADFIVIGAPLYNFSIHSTLKAWIDHIVRSGVTFKHDESGTAGLVTNKKVYVAMSSGFIYSEGDMKAMDFASPYLRAMLGFIGMTDVTFIRAEGTSIPGIQENALQNAITSITVN